MIVAAAAATAAVDTARVLNGGNERRDNNEQAANNWNESMKWNLMRNHTMESKWEEQRKKNRYFAVCCPTFPFLFFFYSINISETLIVSSSKYIFY